MPSATTFFAAESGRISGQAAPSINAHLFSSLSDILVCARTIRNERVANPGAPGAYAAGVPRVETTLDCIVGPHWHLTAA
jgi:hypothetical protein